MNVIVDYGMGNLKSVYNALCSLDQDVRVTSKPDDLSDAQRIILPGVGAFGDAMRELEERGLKKPLQNFLHSGKPFLGICLGLQLLFEKSEENPESDGLGFFPGAIKRFDFADLPGTKVPHMGWNTVMIQKNACPLTRFLDDETYFYFVHSFYAESDNCDHVLATTSYGIDFASMLWKDNVYAAQFHPEKSQQGGLTLLRNFTEL